MGIKIWRVGKIALADVTEKNVCAAFTSDVWDVSFVHLPAV
jgi:hypothetical protein